MKKIFLFVTLFFTFQAFAIEPIQVQVDQKVPHGKGELGVGSRLTIKVGASSNVNGVFLGKVIDPNGSTNKLMFLDEAHSKIYFADQTNVEMGKYDFQPILKPYDQIGGTCTGYAIDHYFQQIYWSGYRQNEELKTELSNEKGRTQLLVDSINEYYLVLQHRFSLVGVMNKMGARFDLKCKSKKFSDSEKARSYLSTRMAGGFPVMISFFTGPDMVDAPFSLQNYEKKDDLDARLWVPRKKGERQSGGHSVVAASLFEAKGRPFLLMLDSDWSEPRVWDMEKYFDEKTAIDEVEFVTCE